MSEVTGMFIRAIESKDNKPILMDTMDCVIYQLDSNKNCTGCISELQCTKLSTLTLIDATIKNNQADKVGLNTGGMSIIEILVDILRAKDIFELNNILPIQLRRKI